MAIVRNIERAIDAMQMKDYEAGLNFVTLALEVAAKNHYQVKRCRNKNYKEFLRKYYWLIQRFTGLPKGITSKPFNNLVIKDDKDNLIGGDAGPDLADVIYHIYRCHIHHGERIPDIYKFSPQNDHVRTTMVSQEPLGALCLPPEIVWGLIATVVFSKRNRTPIQDNGYYLTFDSSVIVDSKIVKPDSDTIRFVSIMKRGAITHFPLVDWWGKEYEIRDFLNQQPENIEMEQDIFFEEKEYKVEHVTVYL